MTVRSGDLTAGDLPAVIQGGMGVGVSGWRLARAVGQTGQLGVVSGTALDIVFARRLQLGDPTGDLRRALSRFPWQAMAQRVLERWWRPEGLGAGERFANTPMPTLPLSPEHVDLLVTSAYCEVTLAREGHNMPVGLNLLAKIQLPALPALLGAMLAGVAVIVMGGGLPTAVPGVLDALARGEAVRQRIDAAAPEAGTELVAELDPSALAEAPLRGLVRPLFLGIVSGEAAARALLRRANGRVDGLVVEHHRAGGHNAPPRRSGARGAAEAPTYGPRDEPDLEAVRELGLPFWLAGGWSRPGSLARAIEAGARGIQVGTAFAACRESGFTKAIKSALLEGALAGGLQVHTDGRASPTGYPFKICALREAPAGYGDIDARPRICDLGFLRTLYRQEGGGVGYRCPAGPIAAFLSAGGAPEEVAGRRCLCNGLLAAIGLGQWRESGREAAILTLGEDWSALATLAARHGGEHGAGDVVRYLLSG